MLCGQIGTGQILQCSEHCPGSLCWEAAPCTGSWGRGGSLLAPLLFLFYWVFKGTVSVPFQYVCTTFTWQRNTVSIYSDFMLCVSQYELFQIEANSRHTEIWNQSDAISHLQKHTSCLTVNIHQQWTYPPYLFFLNLCLLLPFSARTKNKYVTIMQPNPSNQALLFQ